MDFELHVTGRKLGWGFCLKVVWIISTLTILLIGLGTCLAGESPCFQAGMTMEGFMLLLSFPSCLLFLVWSPVIYGWESIHSTSSYVLIWLGAFIVGYVQWFVLLPKIFKSTGITSLGLMSTAPVRRRRRPRRKRHSGTQNAKELKPFSQDGSTPFERVVRASAS